MTTTNNNHAIRSFISDSVWNRIPETDQAALSAAYDSCNMTTIMEYVAAGLLPPMEGMAVYQAAEKARGQRCELLPSFYVDKSGKVGTSVKFVGPSSAGVPFSEVFKHSSEPHVTMSAHQVALVLVYAKQIGIDSALATCRQSLDLAANEKTRLKALKAASAAK